MSEDIYRNEDKGLIISRYCGKDGAKMYQITMHEDFVQLTDKEFYKMMHYIIMHLVKNFEHPTIKPRFVKKSPKRKTFK